jgi:hypothetical protein
MTKAEKIRVVKVVKGLLKIAKIAMPDTYYASDSRIKAAKLLLGRVAKA